MLWGGKFSLEKWLSWLLLCSESENLKADLLLKMPGESPVVFPGHRMILVLVGTIMTLVWNTETALAEQVQPGTQAWHRQSFIARSCSFFGPLKGTSSSPWNDPGKVGGSHLLPGCMDWECWTSSLELQGAVSALWASTAWLWRSAPTTWNLDLF